MAPSGLRCGDCQKNKYHKDEKKLIREGMLPIWYDDCNEAQYKVPEVLSCLRDCEKLLIQRLHTHVPAQHIKFGVLGVKGHVCAFPQDTARVCSILPRLPEDCVTVRYIKETNSRVVAGNEVVMFRVRRAAVLAALRWLKKYHTGYKDILIDEANLDWMEGCEEKDLPATAAAEIQEDGGEMDDTGPSPEINVAPRDESPFDVSYSGVLVEDSPVMASDADREIAEAIEAAGNGDIVLNWPSIDDKAVSELTDDKIFPLAFPWLFPGGIGDIKDFRERNLSAMEWAKRLVMYEDGRFSTDKIFCFYVLNYCVRRRNRESGNFFVNKFSSGCAGDVDSLREAIIEGKSNFINEISYFSKEIKGSDGYWRFKRDELHT